MCNEYLADSSNTTFSYFLADKKYIKTDFEDEVNFLNINSNSSDLSKDLSLDFVNNAKNRKKLAMIVEFFANNNTKIQNSGKSTKEKFLREVTHILAKENINLSLSEETVEKMAQNVAMFDSKMYVPKSHPKLNFLRKRVLRPALIVGAGCGIGASILSTIAIAANTSFISPSVIVTIGAWASAGAVVGAAATAITSIAINKLTRKYYAKKYCEKSKSIEAMDDITTMAELENKNVDLPIKRLMAKLQKTNQKICKNKNSNWFNRVVMNRIYRKIHRNQLWALASYSNYLKNEASAMVIDHTTNTKHYKHTTQQLNRYSLMLDYIDKHLSADMRENFKDYSNKYKKLDNCDIYATIALGKAKKDDLNQIKEKCYDLVKNLSMERYSKTNNEHLFNLKAMCQSEIENQQFVETLYLPEPKHNVQPSKVLYLTGSLDPAKEVKGDNIFEEPSTQSTNEESSTQTTSEQPSTQKDETVAERSMVEDLENKESMVAKVSKRFEQAKANDKQFKTISFKIDDSFARIIKLLKNYKQSADIANGEESVVKVSKSNDSEKDMTALCKATSDYIMTRLYDINDKFGTINDVIIKGNLKNQEGLEKSFVKTLKGTIPTDTKELLNSVEELVKAYLTTNKKVNHEDGRTA